MKDIELNFEIVLAFVGLIVWAIRLEGRVNTVDKMQSETQKDVDAVRTLQSIHEGKLSDQMGDMRESLARIEGYLKIKDE